MDDIKPFVDPFSYEVWSKKYKGIDEEKVEDMWRRLAKTLASIEKEDKREYYENEFYRILSEFNTLGGRIMSNLGMSGSKVSEYNCTVSGPKFNKFRNNHGIDSMISIMNELTEQAIILKSECGYGMNFDWLRPRGTYVKGNRSETPGAVRMMDMWNVISDVITSGAGKVKNKNAKKEIRKGAMMSSISCWHPDCEQFIDAKQVPDKLNKFNMSVCITDDFMEAVKKDKDWDLIFPDVNFENYDNEWDGSIKNWKANKYPVVVYKTLKARELFDKIMKATYNKSEPGVIFIDRVNKLNNLRYSGEEIRTTNPCCAEGTLVNTPRGYKKVEDLKVGDIISTLHPDGYEKIDSIEKHINKEVYKVKFSDGDELRVTSSHIFHSVPKGSCEKKIQKKKLSELKIGDYVQVQPTTLINNKIDTNEWVYKRALLCGLLIGNGCYTDYCIEKDIIKYGTDKTNEELNNNIKKLLFHLGFEYNKSDDIDKKSNSMTIVIKEGKRLLDFLELNKSYSQNKKIPQCYVNDYNSISGLLNGLWATDGDINLKSTHPQLRYKTTSYELAKQIRLLLLSIGIHGRITNNFKQDGGVINGRKIIRKNRIYTITISGYSVKELSKHLYICINKRKSDKIKEAVYNCLLTGNTYKAEILSIEKDGCSNVFDFHCKESDSWITQGYVQMGCGEQPMPANACCNLGSLNLVNYVDVENNDWNYKKLEKDIPLHVRMLDNVNDIGKAPMYAQNQEIKAKRRIGQGVLGYASALYMLDVRYGSKEALSMTEKLCNFWANTAYKASANIASEKGSFPEYNETEYLKSEYLKALDKETLEIIRDYGIRNSHILSIAPTGNTSVYANVVSSGIEPVVDTEYIRTVIIDGTPPEGLKCYDKTVIDWRSKPNYLAYKNDKDEEVNWEWVKEGDDDLLRVEFNNTVYKVDRNRGLTKEVECKDYAVRFLESINKWDPKSDSVVTVLNKKISVEDHINTMKIFAKYSDSAVSKTLNLPYNYSFEDFKNIYMEAYDTGYIKGITTYREGTMASVLKEKDDKDATKKNKKEMLVIDDIELPVVCPSETFTMMVQGQKFYLTTCYWSTENKKPFAVFCKSNYKIKDGHTLHKAYETLIELAEDKGIRKKDINTVVKKIDECVSDSVDKFMRALSLNLRHNVSMEHIVGSLDKVDIIVGGFLYRIKKYLASYIADGILSGEKCPQCKKELMYVEGCVTCKNCGWARC